MSGRDTGLSRHERAGAILLAVLITIVELVLVLSYVRGQETNQRFGANASLITSLANTQREVLRFHVEVDAYVADPRTGPAEVGQQGAILESLILVLRAATNDRPDTAAAVAIVDAEVSRLTSLLESVVASGPDPASLAELDLGLTELERHVKRMYDREEIAYFASTSDSLATQAASQLLLVVVAVALAVVGVVLVLLLRRRLKGEFTKAYVRLEAEVLERQRAELALRHQAYHDALTGVPNRTLFLEQLEEAVRSGDGEGTAVLFVDLDDFKTINDSFGHAAGDALLGTVAERIRHCLRATDVPARLGGDEFAVLLSTDRQDVAEDVARRILAAIRRPIRVGGDTVQISATIGIARSGLAPTDGVSTPAAGPTAEDLLRNADLAMYAAKSSGKNRIETFRAEMHREALRRLSVRTELERAISHREFLVHYQPIVDLSDGAVVAVEALLRWDHPERGLIPPGDFIPVAEESGLVVPIGRWVLFEACTRVAAWIRDGVVPAGFGVSVNLSPRQLQDEDLLRDVEAALRRSGLPAFCLTLEVTETLLVDDVTVAAESLQRLKELGVHLAIDDFGTGYSSLSYLSRFPIDSLKVDRSFVTTAASGDGQAAVLARTIIGLGSAVGLPTIAEGIETPEQVRLVRDLGCRYGQGYLFARPADEATTAAYLRDARGEDTGVMDTLQGRSPRRALRLPRPAGPELLSAAG